MQKLAIGDTTRSGNCTIELQEMDAEPGGNQRGIGSIWGKLDESDSFLGIHKMGVGLFCLGNDTSGTALAHSLKKRRLPFLVCIDRGLGLEDRIIIHMLHTDSQGTQSAA